jgi:serine/threonine protein kinase
MTYEEFKLRYQYNSTTDLLGEGTFGKVCRATDTLTGSRVAIKIAPVTAEYEKYSLLAEFNKLKHVSPHLNIALYDECYRFATDMGTFDIAISEYYPLGSLDKLIKNHGTTLTDIDKNDIVLGILDGLYHLHQLGLIHRDLKPGNVLIQKLRGQYIAKICDFGLSKYSDIANQSMISQSFMGGTANYSSPEQLKGAQSRRNTDLWSFGVILFELFTGEVPYRVDSTSEATMMRTFQQMQVQALPPSFAQIEEPWSSVVRRSLVFDPMQRYSRVEEIWQTLQGIDVEPQHTSPPVASPSQPLAPKESNTTTVLAAIFVILIISIVSGLLIKSANESNTDTLTQDITSSADSASVPDSTTKGITTPTGISIIAINYLNQLGSSNYTPNEVFNNIESDMNSDDQFKKIAVRKFVDAGDKYYINGDCDNAKACYTIAYNYDPASAKVHERHKRCQ